MSDESSIVVTGSGALTLINGSWDCTPTASTEVSCTSWDGQAQFDQVGNPATVSVTVTEPSGATRTFTFYLADELLAPYPTTALPTVE